MSVDTSLRNHRVVDHQVVAALCTRMAWPARGSADVAVKPLTPKMWQSFQTKLHQARLAPHDLPGLPIADLAEQTGIKLEAAAQVAALLQRLGPLAIAWEAMLANGLQVLTQRDEGYPSLLARSLRHPPPLLFVAGAISNLSAAGLAVVGSREPDPPALSLADRLGRDAAAAGVTVISGYARGIDRAAGDAAVAAGGQAVGVLAEGVDRIAFRRHERALVQVGQLTLLSSEPPGTRWTVPRAMARNGVIYGLSQAALVIQTSAGTGGTWNGAVAALKAGRPPVLVWHDAQAAEANRQLVHLGARPFCTDDRPADANLATLLQDIASTPAPSTLIANSHPEGEQVALDAPDEQYRLDLDGASDA